MLDVRTEFHLYPPPHGSEAPIATYVREWPYPFPPRVGESLHVGNSNWRIAQVQYEPDGMAVIKVFVDSELLWLPNALLNAGFTQLPPEED
jgi:hypothetical protein